MKDFFGKGKQKIRGKEWDWENFKTTEGFPISDHLLDWVVGQDQALKECYLCLDEWTYKLKWLEQLKWWKQWEHPEEIPTVPKEQMSPGPYLLLLGEPGTGKSLIGKALADRLTELYNERQIKLFDVLAWKNKVIPSEPMVTVHEAGEGKKVLIKEKMKEARRKFLKKTFFKFLQILLVGLGFTLLIISFYYLGNLIAAWIHNVKIGPFTTIQEYYHYNFVNYMADSLVNIVPILIPGGSLLFFGVMMGWFTKFVGGGGGMKGVGGAEQSDAPKMLVDNSSKRAPFVDATGHGSAQLFGSIAWDPYQTGDLGTPEHQRVTAGDVHRACMGILYIDEIKNLHPEEAITLLSVLEDGRLPVTVRSQWHGGETAAMAVSTAPIPSLTFLVAAGNFDSVHLIHPALMDRIYGYGKVVRMNNDMPNSIENRRKYIQFISQEINRFHLPPFTREACIEIINEGRRRSNKRDGLSTKFRPLISIIKTAATLAINEGSEVTEKKHVIEALEEHCKTIQKQILEHQIQEQGKLMEINPTGHQLGTTYGLAVVEDPVSGEMTGNILRVKATMIKTERKHSGYFKVSGVAKEGKFIHDSIDKVRSIILKKYGVDIAQDYKTHIDFSQAYGIDGPSAGVTMAILLCALLEGKPIRQDIAMTGEITLSSTDEIEITAVGGLYEKIKAAERWGFKKVIIPKKNFDHSIDPKDYSVEVIPGKTLDDYLKEILVEEKDGERKET